MAEEKNTNWTDPKVKFDPTIKKTVVVKSYSPQKDERTGTNRDVNGKPTYEGKGDSTRLEGIYFPIIKLNNIVIEKENIDSMVLDYTGFLPELSLSVFDYDSSIKLTDTPGMRNNITVVIIPPIDGAYRKVSLNFYITEMKQFGTTLIYKAVYDCVPLMKIYNKCFKTAESNSLNTFDFLSVAAKECGLGLAATDNCEQILDTKRRLSFSKNLKDMINQHIGFGGLDKDSIFDCWIDLYDTLVMVNLPYVLNAEITPDELTIHNIIGTNLDDSADFDKNTQGYTDDVARLLTNARHLEAPMNCLVDTFRIVVNNDIIMNEGTHNTYYTINSANNGSGNNSIGTEVTEIIENSELGENYKDKYTFENKEFIGCELANTGDGNTPVLYQEKRRNSYMTNLRGNTLELLLVNPNYGLQRGTLVTVKLYEYEKSNKIRLINMSYLKSNKEILDYSQFDEEDKKIIEDTKIGIEIENVSGMYYIDGMKFKYDDGRLCQYLFLIKKGKTSNLGDVYMPTKEEIAEIEDNINNITAEA